MKEDQPGPREFLNAEEIEFLAELAMVALLRLLHLLEIRFQVLRRKERRAINPLQLLIVLVALPIRAGDGEQLERFDLRRIRHVRPAAEIDELRAQRVFGEDIARALGDELALHPCVGIFAQSFVFLGIDPLIGEIARLDLPHLLFDFFQIFRGKRRRRGRNRNRSRCQ